jgi:D-alanyl-D-alanine carboxypeptidase
MIRAVVAIVLAAALAIAPGSAQPSAAPRSLRSTPPVARVVRELVQFGARSAFAYVSDGGRTHAAAAGTGPPRTRDQRFRVGGVTKAFTAAIVLLLAEEGKLGLDDPLGRFLPGVVPGGNRITVRELLNHTSGLANFTDYTSWRNKAERSKSIRPLDVLRFVASKPRVFAPPGSSFSYSNTNYVALGLIVEKVTGHRFAQELESRIVRPLGLRRTELAVTRRLPDLTDDGVNPNLPWTAGGIVSNAQELVRFYSALLSGHLLSHASLAEIERTVRVPGPGPDRYGLGLALSRLSCGDAWGNEGALLDYLVFVQASPDGRRVAVVVTRGPSREVLDMDALICA